MAPTQVVESRSLSTRTIVRHPLKIHRVASSGYDRNFTAAALSSGPKRRSAQQRDDSLRSYRQCTLVNRGTRTARQRYKWRVRQLAEHRARHILLLFASRRESSRGRTDELLLVSQTLLTLLWTLLKIVKS